MDITPLQQRLDASDVPLERLAGNSQLTEEQKVGEATRQFEAVLLREILESTQKTVFRSSFSDESTAAGIYRSLVTNQLADSISKSRTLGLSKMLEHQLTRQLHPVLAGGDRKTEALPTAHANSDAARPSFANTEHPRPTENRAAPPPGPGAAALTTHERSSAQSD